MQKYLNPLDDFQINNFQFSGKNNKNKLKIFFSLFIVLAISSIAFFVLKNKNALIQLGKSTNTFSVQKNVIDQADDDGDGLLNSEENIYGTDPNKSDSDSDTFNDYEEIQNGYNPNGEGILDKKNVNLSLTKKTNSGSLRALGEEREYRDERNGYSFVLQPDWIYMEKNETADFELSVENEKIVRMTIQKNLTKEYLYNIDNKKDIGLREMDNFLGRTYISGGYDKIGEFNIGSGNGYIFQNTIGDLVYMGVIKERNEFNLNYNYLVLITIDFFGNVDKKIINDVNKMIGSFRTFQNKISPDIYFSGKMIPSLDACANYKSYNEKDNCFHDLSVRLSDRQYCEHIQAQKNYERCLTIQNDPIKGCETDTLNKDNCFYSLALSKNKVEYCYKTSETKKESCLSRLALLNTEANYCKDLKNIDLKDLCFCDVASKRGKEDYGLCVNIKKNSTKIRCYNNIAKSTNNPDICSNITGMSNDYTEECYIIIAKRKKDKEICKKINNIKTQNDCTGFINNDDAFSKYLSNRMKIHYEKNI